MNIDIKILEELKRFNQINRYIINEQEAEVAPPAEAPMAGAAPDVGVAPEAGAAPDAGVSPEAGVAPESGSDVGAEVVPEPIDVESDPDVEEVDKEKKEDEEGETEEIDITDLVTSQKEIKDKQDEFMDNIFAKLDDLEQKLTHMDEIMNKINSLETKFDKYREKSPEEKLMLRSLDSYPYNQKLTDFFDDKKQEMEETGKNEYVLTTDEIENFSPSEVKKTFNSYDVDEE